MCEVITYVLAKGRSFAMKYKKELSPHVESVVLMSRVGK